MRDLIDSVRGTDRPAAIFRRNTLIFGVAYTLLAALLVYGLATKAVGRTGFGVALWGTILIPPMYVWITFAECRRAWRGEQPNENLDSALPLLGFAALGVALHFSLL
jgi:hypothetical protein